MENRAYAALAILFLAVLIGGSAYLFYWLQAAEPEDRIYLIDSPYGVGDLHAQGKVTYKGLVVGHVKEVGFHPEDPDRVRIRIGIQHGVPITESMYAELGLQGLTGTNYLALKKDPGASDAPLETSEDSPAHIPMRRGGIRSLMAAAEEITGQVEQLARRLNKVAGEDNRERVKRILVRAEESLARLEKLERGLQPSIAMLPGILKETESAIGESRRLLSRARRLVATTERQVIRAGEAATAVEGAGRAGQELLRRSERSILPDLEATLQRLKRTAANLESLSRQLERYPGSILFGAPEPPAGPGEPGFAPRPEAPEGEAQ